MSSFVDVFGRAPKVLWIASSGGHVAQAHRIERILGVNADSRWVTFDVPQTRSLLVERRVDYIDYVAPRDFRGAAHAAMRIRRIEREESFDFVVSTGSAVAFFALPLVALVGHTPTFYVESLARSSGPSLTGRIMRIASKVKTYTQYESWSSNAWKYTGTILDSFHAEDGDARASGGLRIFVTLGTIRPYRFDRLVDAIKEILAPEDRVVWQLGETDRHDLPGEIHGSLPGDEMERHVAESDVVVTHAGVGSILSSLEHGKVPIVAVRESTHDEHVDDHQKYISDVTVSRGIAIQLDVQNPNRALLYRAATKSVVSDLGAK